MILAGLVSALLLALVLPACGGGGGSSEPPAQEVPQDPQPSEPPPAPPPPEPWPLFEDVTIAAGVNTPHGVVLDYLVTGQAWGDVDGDGRLDLYLTSSMGSNALYTNLGDGTFTPSAHAGDVALATAASGGAVFVDYDNDGWKDLYVLNKGPNTLFRNLAGEGFEDVTATAGVGDDGVGETAGWGDYDEDGYLDLYVCNWGPRDGEVGYPVDFDTGRDRLYRNLGDGTFADVSHLVDGFLLTGYGFVASFVDYDDDGDLDIYLVNDKGYDGDPPPGRPVNRNVLWRNDGSDGSGGWVFTEVATEVGADARLSGMGVAIGDYDNDLDLDLYCTSIGHMHLLENLGDGSFDGVWKAEDAGIETPGTGWGCVWSDFDLDGWLDLYVARSLLGPCAVYINRHDGTFQDVSADSGAALDREAMGVAYADYDGDGWVDLVVGDYGTGYRLYRNRGAETGRDVHAVVLRLIGGGPVNRDAVGARVYVTRTDGLVMMREVVCGSSMCSGSDLALHFGLGEAGVQQVRVLWPDGTEQLVDDVPLDLEHPVAYPTD